MSRASLKGQLGALGVDLVGNHGEWARFVWRKDPERALPTKPWLVPPRITAAMASWVANMVWDTLIAEGLLPPRVEPCEGCFKLGWFLRADAEPFKHVTGCETVAAQRQAPTKQPEGQRAAPARDPKPTAVPLYEQRPRRLRFR